MMKLKSLLKIFFFSLLVMIAVSPLRGFANFQTSSLVGFFLFFFLTNFCLSKFISQLSVAQILVAVVTGLWILQLPMRIIYFESSLASLPDSLIHTLGIVCGFLYWRLKKPLNILTALLGSLLALFMFFQGYDYWLHKLNFGTFTGKTEPVTLSTNFEVFNEQENFINENDLKGKIVLLDFWFTKCGVCFEKFPQVQKAYNKYENDASVIILAVNTPIEEDRPKQAFEMIKEQGYSFPVVISKDEELPEKLGVKGYPTTLVINPSGMIVFKGDIAGAIKLIDEIRSEETAAGR